MKIRCDAESKFMGVGAVEGKDKKVEEELRG